MALTHAQVPMEEASLELTLDAVSAAEHPSIARAVGEILRDQETGAMFSNFVSHSSAAE